MPTQTPTPGLMWRRPALQRLAVAALAPALAPRAWAQEPPKEVRAAWPSVQLLGQGRFRYFGLAIYDARLWRLGALSPSGWADMPLALELVYLRDLSGAAIAERSLVEMQRQGPVSPQQTQAWMAVMRAAFPDVREGDRLVGLYQPEQAARFFHNGRLTAEGGDAEFARRFFGIWLAPSTSAPALRRALLGHLGG